MLNMDEQIRRSSEITCHAAEMYHKDLEYDKIYDFLEFLKKNRRINNNCISH